MLCIINEWSVVANFSSPSRPELSAVAILLPAYVLKLNNEKSSILLVLVRVLVLLAISVLTEPVTVTPTSNSLIPYKTATHVQSWLICISAFLLRASNTRTSQTAGIELNENLNSTRSYG